MIKNKSLKKEILYLLIVFPIFIIVSTAIYWGVSQYNSKINAINHYQNQVLYQVKKETTKFIEDILNTASLLKKSYSSDETLIDNIVKVNSNISSIIVLNKKGIIKDIASEYYTNTKEGFDFSQKVYFSNISSKTTQYWSDFFLSTISLKPTISYSFTYEDKIFVIMLKLSELSEFISRFKNIDGSYMLRVFDKNGIIILNPGYKDIAMQRFNASGSEVYTKLIDKKPEFTQATFTPLRAKSVQYGSYVNIPKTDWKVLVRQEYKEINNILKNTIIVSLVFILIFSMFSIFLILKVSSRLFKSFNKLQKNVLNIKRGEYKESSYNLYYTEFNNLLKQFDEMKIEIDKREDNLEESLDSFKKLFNSTLESIVLTKNGIIKDVNDITLSLFNANSKDEFIGKNMMDFILPDYRQIVAKNLSKDTLPYEVELYRMDKSIMHVYVQGKLLKFKGEDVRLTAIIDVTELKEKEKLLYEKSKMASMGEMIGNIAHQWRQPLSVITTCASGVKLEKEIGTLNDEKLNTNLDIVLDNAKYLSKTIDDFRNFFKTSKEKNQFKLSSTIHRALKLLSASLKNNNIEVQLNIDEYIEIYGFENELLQVLINILNNSKDAFILNEIEQREMKINLLEKNKKIYLDVIDYAGGIKESILSNIFEPYFTTKHQTQGTGIGLYMSHKIVHESMNGELSVINMYNENQERVGCKFTIVLPLDEKEKSYNHDFII